MGYEVDYIPVGDGGCSGDAICLRYGNLYGTRSEQTVIIIDGGFKSSGREMVKHILNYYGTNEVDIVIATHLDKDHISGLEIVLKNLIVKQLVIHQPWEHAQQIKSYFSDGRLTATGLEKKFEKSLKQAVTLVDLAKSKKIDIREPFEGIKNIDGSIHILGPSQNYYETLLTQYKCTPDPIDFLSFLKPIIKAVEKVINWVEDSLDIDLLNDDSDPTSAENKSSAIILITVDKHKLLFTGDCGKKGLLEAVNYANSLGITLTDLNFFDIPHHGSKNNINSKILTQVKGRTAFISAAKGSAKHPSKLVTNALQKPTNNAKVFVNKDKTLRHHFNAPQRKGWGPAENEPFYNKIEN